MELKDQVCNQELSKRLCELGVPQESLFYWVEDTTSGEYKLTNLSDGVTNFWCGHKGPSNVFRLHSRRVGGDVAKCKM